MTAGTSFLGAKLSESNFVPPDSMGAVGPSQILVDVNGRIKVFDKNGNIGGLNLTDSQFWAPVRNGAEPTDPGVEYDRLSQRWIVSAINIENTNNRIMLAVSDGPTITDASSFTYFFFNEASPPPSGPARFADYPQLGVDANAIYIGVNEFTSSSGSFTGTSAYVIRKSSVLSGGPIVVTAFRNLASGSGQGPDSPQPATDMNPNVARGLHRGPRQPAAQPHRRPPDHRPGWNAVDLRQPRGDRAHHGRSRSAFPLRGPPAASTRSTTGSSRR